MNDQSMGYYMGRLFMGYSLLLASTLLNMLDIASTVAGVLSIAGIIITMIALSHLKAYHRGYGQAFNWEIFLLVFSVLSTVLAFVAVFIPFLVWLVVPLIAVGSAVLGYMVVHNMCQATADLTGDAGDLDTAALGAMTDKVYLVCCGVSVVCVLLGLLPLLSALPLRGLVSNLAALVGDGLLVYFLYKAKTSLN